ncbi:TPA: ATP-binding protein [Pseudomonas putida]|nr:ATP-binding protein [Pseudomonas putida]
MDELGRWMDDDNFEEIGRAPSLIEKFTIEGLYKYRTLSLSSEFSATILIAKNGSGKTTLLGALDAVLKGQFLRLTSLEFSKITCKLRGVDEDLVIDRVDIDDLIKVSETSEVANYARRIGVDSFALMELLDGDYRTSLNEYQSGDEVADKIVSQHGYSSGQAYRSCEKLAAAMYEAVPKLDAVKHITKQALRGYEVVYLPTYRRVELPLDLEAEDARRPRKKKNIRNRLGIGRRSLFSPDIQFGLSDISERLSHLNQEILFDSNQGYRKISADIISELIGGDLDKDQMGPFELPDKEALAIFFSRLKDNRGIHYRGDVTIPDLDKVYSGDISVESNKFLSYFLDKLSSVIKATRGVEEKVEEFIRSCNNYLSEDDESTSVNYNDGRYSYTDNKELVLDRKTFQVNVKSLATSKKISLEFLSSGEKQMISLFARLYLYPKKKIFLIDEPELSLSLNWQRKILLDVMASNLCEQVIAITHSPFVFDNALEPFAKSLDFIIDVKAEMEAAKDEEHGDINE